MLPNILFESVMIYFKNMTCVCFKRIILRPEVVIHLGTKYSMTRCLEFVSDVFQKYYLCMFETDYHATGGSKSRQTSQAQLSVDENCYHSTV